MQDLLVKLYNLPDIAPIIENHKAAGIEIRKPIAPEKHIIVPWVRKEFNDAWADECEAAFSNHPVSFFIAVKDEKIIGFSCYDATYKDYFGPIGVSEEFRKQGIGKVLLLSCLHAMAEEGYAYAIIPTGSFEFYKKVVDTTQIEGSDPIYRGNLKKYRGSLKNDEN